MKKIFGLLLLCVYFLLVGCGKKNSSNEENNNKPNEDVKKDVVLVCSHNTEGQINFITEMSYYFENDKAVKLGIKYYYDLSNYNDAQKQSFASAKMCETDAMKTTVEMIDCKEELQGNQYIVEGFSEKLLGQTTSSYSATKSSYESGGWTCVTK